MKTVTFTLVSGQELFGSSREIKLKSLQMAVCINLACRMERFPDPLRMIEHIRLVKTHRKSFDPVTNQIQTDQSDLLLLVSPAGGFPSMRVATLAAHHRPVASCYVLQCLIKLLPKPDVSKAEASCPVGKLP